MSYFGEKEIDYLWESNDEVKHLSSKEFILNHNKNKTYIHDVH